MGVKGKRALSLVAALAIATAACPVTALARGGELASQAEEGIPVTSDTHVMGSGTYIVTGDVTIWPDTSNNGIRIEPGASVNLILVDGAKLTVWGAGAYEAMPGSAAIQLPEGSSLNVSGRGTLIAQGGSGGAGGAGGKAAESKQGPYVLHREGYGYDMYTGSGGRGGGRGLYLANYQRGGWGTWAGACGTSGGDDTDASREYAVAAE